MRFVCIILLLSLLVVSCSEDISNTGNSKGKAGGLVFPPPTSLSWSPDGDWILFMEFSAMQITRADDINDVTPISGTGQYTEPVWSPDGQRIAYVYAPRYLTSDIWVKFAHQNVPNIRITSDRSSDSSPSWSSDGTMIAFQSRRMGNWDIWLKKSDASGSAVQFTTDAGNDKNPAWSPDGTKIAFLSNRSGNYDIWVKSVKGTGALRQITDTIGFEEYIKWSHDGGRIAYLDKRRSKTGIWVQNISDSGSEIQITASGEVYSYDWLPNGDFIIYQAGNLIAGKRSDGTGDEIQVDEGKEPICSPDGQKIAYVRFNGERYKINVINVPEEFKP